MKWLLVVLATLSMPCFAGAAGVDIATTTCERYVTEVLGPDAAGATADPIDTMMWLFGFSVARAGNHVMYGGALSSFGFALDAECKNNPTRLLTDALKAVKPKRDNPMDLTTLSCASYEKRHIDLAATDQQSANTLLMWLYGFSVGVTGGHVLNAGALEHFGAKLAAECAVHPTASVFDAVSSLTL